MNKYAKLKDEQTLEYAPNAIQKFIDGKWTWFIPYPVEMMLEDGYLPVIDTPYPQDGKSYSGKWVQEADCIRRVWEEIPVPPQPEPTPAEKREHEYETRLCIVYPENSNDLITVDAAVKLVMQYSCETTKRAAEIVAYLRPEITEKKQMIRDEFPDED